MPCDNSDYDGCEYGPSHADSLDHKYSEPRRSGHRQHQQTVSTSPLSLKTDGNDNGLSASNTSQHNFVNTVSLSDDNKIHHSVTRILSSPNKSINSDNQISCSSNSMTNYRSIDDGRDTRYIQEDIILSGVNCNLKNSIDKVFPKAAYPSSKLYSLLHQSPSNDHINQLPAEIKYGSVPTGLPLYHNFNSTHLLSPAWSPNTPSENVMNGLHSKSIPLQSNSISEKNINDRNERHPHYPSLYGNPGMRKLSDELTHYHLRSSPSSLVNHRFICHAENRSLSELMIENKSAVMSLLSPNKLSHHASLSASPFSTSSSHQSLSPGLESDMESQTVSFRDEMKPTSDLGLFNTCAPSSNSPSPLCSDSLPLDDIPVSAECRWKMCSLKFSSQKALAQHVNDCHVRIERPDADFQCHWQGCPRQGKGFNARYKMLIHIRTHTNEKPHKCAVCRKCFSRLENLKIHMRSHTGEKPYACTFPGCTKAYSNSSDRFKHVRTHQEEKPYKCKMAGCHKQYTDPSSLRKHVRTHGHNAKNENPVRKASSNSDTMEDLQHAVTKDQIQDAKQEFHSHSTDIECKDIQNNDVTLYELPSHVKDSMKKFNNFNSKFIDLENDLNVIRRISENMSFKHHPLQPSGVCDSNVCDDVFEIKSVLPLPVPRIDENDGILKKDVSHSDKECKTNFKDSQNSLYVMKNNEDCCDNQTVTISDTKTICQDDLDVKERREESYGTSKQSPVTITSSPAKHWKKRKIEDERRLQQELKKAKHSLIDEKTEPEKKEEHISHNLINGSCSFDVDTLTNKTLLSRYSPELIINVTDTDEDISGNLISESRCNDKLNVSPFHLKDMPSPSFPFNPSPPASHIKGFHSPFSLSSPLPVSPLSHSRSMPSPNTLYPSITPYVPASIFHCYCEPKSTFSPSELESHLLSMRAGELSPSLSSLQRSSDAFNSYLRSSIDLSSNYTTLVSSLNHHHSVLPLTLPQYQSLIDGSGHQFCPVAIPTNPRISI